MYVNYGRIEDFLYLTQNKSMDLTNKTLIARYGKIFRGDKVHCTYACYCQLPKVIQEGLYNVSAFPAIKHLDMPLALGVVKSI